MKIVLFWTIQFSIIIQFKCKYSLIVINILFPTIQFSHPVLIQLIQFTYKYRFCLYTVKCQTILY